ncbi:DUF397 domain-containing protein [Streptomyces tendae]|uniref:DUF397 domain-containing protein n=1 Tax=Streptomyces tendae TaxID=1932 RepID=UPI0036832A2B
MRRTTWIAWWLHGWPGSRSSSAHPLPRSASSLTPATIHIRDSKHTDGPRLTLTPAAWANFLPYAAQR